MALQSGRKPVLSFVYWQYKEINQCQFKKVCFRENTSVIACIKFLEIMEKAAACMLSEETNQGIGPDIQSICCPPKEVIETDFLSQREGYLFNFNYYYFFVMELSQYVRLEQVLLVRGCQYLVEGWREGYCFELGGGRAFWDHFLTGLSWIVPLSFPYGLYLVPDCLVACK